MTRNQLYGGLAGVGVIALFAIFFLTREGDAEAEIRKVIDRTVQAAEEKDLGTMMEAIHTDFKGHGLDRREIQRYMFALLHRGRWRRIFLANTRVKVESDVTAEVKTLALLARADDKVETVEQAASSASADTFEFTINFQKEDGDWRVIRLRYKRSDPKSFLEDLVK